MSSSIFRVVPLPTEYDRKIREPFNSGSLPLDRYFREKVTQDTRNNLAKCYIALNDDRIDGFYTLSAGSITLADLPEDRKKRLRYEQIPSVRIGRLAVDKDFRGKGLGSNLLIDSLVRTIDAPMGVYAVSVDAIDETAMGFYLHHDFIPLKNRPYTLFFPMEDAISSQPK